MKKLLTIIIGLLIMPVSLWAQTGQFKAIATSATSFTWYFIPSQDFTSTGSLTFDVTVEIDNSAGCTSGNLTTATVPSLAVSNITYGNTLSKSAAVGTASSGGAKVASGVPAFLNQRYIFGVASTNGLTFSAGVEYPLATFTLPSGISSINCIKILDWNNDRIGSGVSTGPVNGDTHISINGSAGSLLDNNAAIFIQPVTTNGYTIPLINNSGSSSGTSTMPLGWDERPIANVVTQTIAQPIVDQIITLNGGANPPAQNGSDIEDGLLGGAVTSSTATISQLPTNGELYYNGVLVTLGQVIPNFDASKVTVKLTGSGYTSTAFMYTFTDSKGFESLPASYTLNWALPLPVKLVSFTASKEGVTAQLSWSTTEESNADRFEIQRSIDAKSWNTIGSRAAKGESKALVNYSFADVSPISGINYYRLKMIDKDATFAYSRIVNVTFEGVGVKLYPNPVSDVLYLKDIDTKNVKEVLIVNASGVSVLGSSSLISDGISVKGLSSGIYMVKVIKTDGSQSMHKIVVVK